jgi:hypothetical protein
MEKEIWIDIQDFKKGYQISNLGRVKSLDKVIVRSNGAKMTIKERILKTFINSNGYETAVIQDGVKTKHFAVHRLVALHFIPLIDGKDYVNHIDGVKKNNTVDNLEWVTRSENEKHAHKLGLKDWRGENQSRVKLTEKKVFEIRSLEGVKTAQVVAKMYNVTHSAIFAIWKKRTWSHL